MKIFKNKTLLILSVSSLIIGCTPEINNIYPQSNQFKDIQQEAGYGTVKLRFDFPAKYVPQSLPFSAKSIDVGKINRVKVKVVSATGSFSIERNIELIPGGIEAYLSLPLDRLYIITVQGLNDTNPVSGAEIKGYFQLTASLSTPPTIEVNQATTPVAKILEELKSRLPAQVAGASPSNALAPTASVAPSAPASPTASSAPGTTTATASAAPQVAQVFKISDINLAELAEVVNRARGAFHPSMINPTPFVDYIITNKKVPVEVPENALFKPGSVKGTITGLKFNEVAIVTVSDPSSKQAILVTPKLISSVSDTSVDPDKIADSVNFVIDNITPGNWEVSAVASGYVESSKEVKKVAVTSNTQASNSFTFTPAEWTKNPLNLSGNIGTSDQPSYVLDFAGNIHTAWRQDGFDTDANSGQISYSRWNGTSWTTQGVNISQYGNSGLRGSKDPSIAVGLDRLPHIVWSGKDSSGSRSIYYTSFNGTIWKTPSVIPESLDGVTPSITADKTNGFLYAGWESGGTIYLSQFNRTTWSSPVIVGSGSIPKVAMGTDGIVHIVWKASVIQALQYASWSISKGLGSVELIPFGTHGSDVDNFIDTAIDRFNRLNVVWRNDTYIQYILRSNVSWSSPEIVNQISAALSPASSGASISIAPTGIVNVAWATKTKDGKDVVRFRRRLNEDWKKPFEKILDPTEVVSSTTTTTTTTTTTEVKHSENIDGYEDVPLSQLTKVEGTPLIIVDNSGTINVLWTNKGDSNNNKEVLHSIKTTTAK